MRVILTVVTSIVFLLAVSAQSLLAVAASDPKSEGELHVVRTAELHGAVVAASAEAAAARKSVQDFLARPEVQTQIERIGLESADLQSRVAQLSDSEILRLQSLMMSANQQIQTAGIPGGITLFVALGIILVLVIILAAML